LPLLAGSGMRFLTYGGWSHAGGIAVQFLVDRLSLAFAALSAAILGIVAAFSHRYLHREPGFHRYFVLLAMFATGMELIALAGNVEVLFIGWELVGLSSALLIAFFHERPATLVNGLRVFSVYRLSDAALLSAAVMLQLRAGNGGLEMLFSGGADAGVGGGAATAIAVLLIIAVAGKSALIPFSGWLPRAMEGPTPSSAVYYGALSVHAGCFLLLRASPLLAHAPAARILAGVLGGATAAFAATATRVQSDVKSSLAYASLTQVGLIVVEIALGWRLLAFVHLAGHMCLRLLQLLSAPNVLHDLHSLSGDATRRRPWLSRMLPERQARRLYLFALERGFLDTLLDQAVVHPFLNLARRMSQVDARLCGAVLAASTPPADAGAGDE
jgi:NAD(P)H-quinone oxidoreductase subunit 5